MTTGDQNETHMKSTFDMNFFLQLAMNNVGGLDLTAITSLSSSSSAESAESVSTTKSSYLYSGRAIPCVLLLPICVTFISQYTRDNKI